MTKKQTIRRFREAFIRKYGKRAEFSYQQKDLDDEDQIESIAVSVPLDEFEWGEIEPGVEALLKSSGASRYFEIGGAGTGFGFRDISIYRK